MPQVRSLQHRHARRVIGRDDEGQHFFQTDPHALEVDQAQPRMPAGGDDALHIHRAKAGDAPEQLTRRAVDIDGKQRPISQCPGELGIELQIEVRVLARQEFTDVKAIEAQQPVGLVKAVLADKRRRLDGQQHTGLGDGAEAAVIHAAQAVIAVKLIRPGEHQSIAGFIGAHDHLGALAGGKDGRFGPWCVANLARFFACGDRLFDLRADAAHGLLGVRQILFRSQLVQALLRGQLNIDADAVRVAPGFFDELLRGFRDGFEMDVTPEVMHLAQLAGDLDDLLHGEVRAAHDAAAEEEAFDVVPLVEIQRELHDFLRREARALHIAGAAIDAVVAVVEAGVGEQDLEQRHTTPIRRVAVANAHATGGADAFAISGIFPCRSRAGARGVILRGIGQDFEFAGKLHAFK